jgi:predicted adenine nucleotide alpha hydrolase (AANH) superfamily ATPase
MDFFNSEIIDDVLQNAEYTDEYLPYDFDQSEYYDNSSRLSNRTELFKSKEG